MKRTRSFFTNWYKTVSVEDAVRMGMSPFLLKYTHTYDIQDRSNLSPDADEDGDSKKTAESDRLVRPEFQTEKNKHMSVRKLEDILSVIPEREIRQKMRNI